jgi:tRNA-2-methylthio-N6-dimethylallyladenosine synthase
MSNYYHFWISGCQMNYADARQVADRLEDLGYQATPDIERANVIVLQTCTVRQQSEEKAMGRLTSLRPLKDQNPNLTLAMMGCVVGVKGNQVLEKQFPYVDVWLPPASDGDPLIAHLQQGEDQQIEEAAVARRFAWQDEEMALPLIHKEMLVSAPVAIVYGCSHACTFCIIPQRRGIERTRPVGQIVAEVRNLVAQGVKEVVLLGQIVDRYGKDIPDGPDLADLLRVVNGVDGLERIRFLTSHPSYMTDKILQAVADLPKVMPQIEIPIQAGDDQVLENMKRGYTAAEYRRLIDRVRRIVPDVAIHTDIIVGFPGETDAQFEETHRILDDLRLDKVHLARYSPRPGTVSDRRMDDDVADAVKRERFQRIEALQKQVSAEKMRVYRGETVQVLVEDLHKGRWRGRTPQNKLVFFDDPRELKGQLVDVQISWTGPWSMSGRAIDKPEPAMDMAIPLAVL